MELNLPPDIETTLRQQAEAAGVDAEQLAIARLQEALGNDDANSADVMLPRDQWKSRFDALIADMPTRESETRVDCSRDSIYGDRGR